MSVAVETTAMRAGRAPMAEALERRQCDGISAPTCVRVLLVCAKARAELVRQSFDRALHLAVEIEQTERLEEALERLVAAPSDIVLLEPADGQVALADQVAQVREAEGTAAIVVLSRLDDSALRQQSIIAGADDFVVTAWVLGSTAGPRLLERSVRFAIERRRQRVEIERLSERFRHLAHYDPLTGIRNRRGLEQVLESVATRCEMASESLTVVLADCDDFKSVNETHGHAAGDVVLTEMALRLRQSVRPGDTVARVGGDEFILLFPGTNIAMAVEIAERARRAIVQDLVEIDETHRITASMSFGVASVDPSAATIEALLTRSRLSLEASKETGKNQVSAVPANVEPHTNIAAAVKPDHTVEPRMRVRADPVLCLRNQAVVGYRMRGGDARADGPVAGSSVSPADRRRLVESQQCAVAVCLSAARSFPPDAWIEIEVGDELLSEADALRAVLLHSEASRLERRVYLARRHGDHELAASQVTPSSSAARWCLRGDRASLTAAARPTFSGVRAGLLDVARVPAAVASGTSSLADEVRSLLSLAEAIGAELVFEVADNEEIEMLRSLGVPFVRGAQVGATLELTVEVTWKASEVATDSEKGFRT